ncbi:ATP-binding protein [Tepidibacter thalassicus]|uniref:Serine/threonine-protein kinase RsbW n=1 Tax=Tepidibacter thalassicus DSM 15285 TaxID=1123350 RepID=A0A1M5RVF3_9FIRM|nr:ATP-binding protein [Tepidibacter thalassicus]SHH30275.1 serine/threonine-protein kinase RsbW [Tepidibacter thalassicus DSM 15285]
MPVINNEEIGDKIIESIDMTVPSKPEYVGVIRLTVSAIANRMGFNIDEIEDIKVAVAEGCTNAIKHGLDDKFYINFEIGSDSLSIVIKDNGKGCNVEEIDEPDLLNLKEGGLGLFIIKTLMDEVEFVSKKGKGCQIKMIKFLGDDI